MPRLHHQRDLLGSAAESYFDPFNGRDDLADRVLRVVDPRTFGDDSLRVLRADPVRRPLRGQARAGRRSRLCRVIPLDDLPSASGAKSRSCSCKRERPSLGLQLALDLGIVERLWPELHALVGCEQDPEWHRKATCGCTR